MSVGVLTVLLMSSSLQTKCKFNTSATRVRIPAVESGSRGQCRGGMKNAYFCFTRKQLQLSELVGKVVA